MKSIHYWQSLQLCVGFYRGTKAGVSIFRQFCSFFNCLKHVYSSRVFFNEMESSGNLLCHILPLMAFASWFFICDDVVSFSIGNPRQC